MAILAVNQKESVSFPEEKTGTLQACTAATEKWQLLEKQDHYLEKVYQEGME